MSDRSHPRATCRSFEEKYWRFRSPTVRSVLRSIFGDDLPTGYTTPEQAERLARDLGLGPGDRLLDVGAGRGWPGASIARETGCALFSTDLPLEALGPGKRRLDALGLRPSPGVVGCDARALPFRPAVFNAVVHADVLC